MVSDLERSLSFICPHKYNPFMGVGVTVNLNNMFVDEKCTRGENEKSELSSFVKYLFEKMPSYK